MQTHDAPAPVVFGWSEAFRLDLVRGVRQQFAHTVTVDTAVCVDAVQSAVCEAHIANPRTSNLRDWLFVVACRKVLDHMKSAHVRTGRRADSLPADLWERAVARRDPCVIDAMMREQSVNALHEQIAQLKPKHRSVLQLHYLHGVALDAIARQWGVPDTTVRMCAVRARKALGKRLLHDPRFDYSAFHAH